MKRWWWGVLNPSSSPCPGPGNLIGELGLLDGKARYASCVAATPLRAAVLTRESLDLLMHEEPAIAAKLILGISMRIGVRLREVTDKLKMYVQLTQAMEREDRLTHRGLKGRAG